MTTKFFEGVSNLDELKAAYRRLAMQYHPDRGGDVETMKAINDEHDRLFEILKDQHNATHDEHHQTTETPAEFRTILDLLLKLDGLTIELCGAWLWISGNTYEHKTVLKGAGCRWSNNKTCWYWRHEEASRPWHRGTATMGEIRTKYGSTVFTRSGDVAPEQLSFAH